MFTYQGVTLCPTCTRRRLAFYVEQYGRAADYVSLVGLIALVGSIGRFDSDDCDDDEIVPQYLRAGICADCGEDDA